MNMREVVRSTLGRMRDRGPELVGGIVRVGVEAILEAHGGADFGAKELAFFAGAVAREGVSAAAAHGLTQRAIIRVAPIPDATVTPAWFVFALPVEREHVQSRVMSVSPRIWLAPQVAWVYAEHAARDDLELSSAPYLISAEESMSRTKPDELTKQAWSKWVEQRRLSSSNIAKDVPFGPYVLGELPDTGIVAWQPVLTLQGMVAGTLDANYECSLTRAPLVFRDEGEARRELHKHELDVLPIVYLPSPLAADLDVDPLGSVIRAQRIPRLWFSDPTEVRISRSSAPVQAPNLHPELYVSEIEHGVVAWKPLDRGRVSFVRLQRADGTWGTAVWPSTRKCLEDLGRLGIWGQEQTGLKIVPSVTVREATPSGPRL